MSVQAKIIEDSISPDGIRLTTMQVRFHRFVLPEFNTHRVFSRNFSSSRAIPTRKLIQMVRMQPAMPVHWGKNQSGMQAAAEMDAEQIDAAKFLWMQAANYAADAAEYMAELGGHKQIVNRPLEPYLFVTGIVTATEWDNFFELRAHPDAQPEIQALAFEMQRAIEGSMPKELKPGEWHLPYVTDNEKQRLDVELAKKVSAARCCRVSYLKNDGTASTLEEDLALCERLAGARPIHASPFEHQATPVSVGETEFLTRKGRVGIRLGLPEGVSHIDMDGNVWSGNLRGWIQHRKLIEASFSS